MESSKTLKRTVEKAQKQIEELLTEVQCIHLSDDKLELGLKKIQEDLKVVDIHLAQHPLE